MSGAAGPLDLLEGQHYVRLTTFRRSGKAVPTTIWFALVEDKAYVFTGANSGKVERIRNDPRVTVTPSNFRGKPTTPGSMEAEARIVEIGFAGDRRLPRIPRGARTRLRR
jgi:PPOX class probable F420-dependent enzyme